MAQFDVYRLGDGVLVVDVQSDFVPSTPSRLVIPLVPPDEDASFVPRLNPSLVVADEALLLATHLAAAISKGQLRQPITSLAEREYEIKAALDMLISGF